MTGFGTETMVPGFHCTDADATVAFWHALGFRLTYEMRKPYLYLAFEWHSIALHYSSAPPRVVPEDETTGGALIMVDDVAPYHAALTAAMRASYGKVLARGLPRLTRFRPGQSRFSLVDPSGNTLIFINRDEPEDLDYGGDPALDGLARVIDNSRILRDFKTDVVGAARVLDAGLRRFAATAPPRDHAAALAARAELAVLLDDPDRAREIAATLSTLPLSPEDRVELAEILSAATDLRDWLAER